jgi:hypothetical protein
MASGSINRFRLSQATRHPIEPAGGLVIPHRNKKREARNAPYMFFDAAESCGSTRQTLADNQKMK